jgi:hypothetical protein
VREGILCVEVNDWKIDLGLACEGDELDMKI